MAIVEFKDVSKVYTSGAGKALRSAMTFIGCMLLLVGALDEGYHAGLYGLAELYMS